MNNVTLTNIFRFFIFVLIQVFILKNIDLGEGVLNYLLFYIYPLFIILLPSKIPHVYLILLGFLIGISIDLFYNSYGIHASAAVFTAYIRPYVLSFLEPRGGYVSGEGLTKYRYGETWFLQYSAFLLVIHLLFLFSVEAFTFIYIKEILLRTFFSFMGSFLLVIIYIFLFNPKD